MVGTVQTSAQTFLRIDSTGVSKAKHSERAASKHCCRASPSLPKSLLVVLIFLIKAGISYGVEDMKRKCDPFVDPGIILILGGWGGVALKLRKCCRGVLSRVRCA